MSNGEDGSSPYSVVDSSVAMKWVLDDEDAVAEAVALRDDALAGRLEMVAPSLWQYEVTNGLATGVRRGRLSSEQGAEAIRHLLALGVRMADPEAANVYQKAVDLGIAAYDAAYLALAERLGALLWTGDRRFYDAVRHRANSVRWIGDYGAD